MLQKPDNSGEVLCGGGVCPGSGAPLCGVRRMNSAAPLSLSIFLPCYNDAMTIGSMALLAAQTAAALTDDFEIIVVNDGSSDQSVVVLDNLQRLMGPRLRVVKHEKNRGYGGALRSGFAAAQKQWIYYTDGDAQYDITELTQMAALIRADVDVVQGYKIKRHDPLHRVWIGLAYQHFIKWLFALRIRDVDCDCRLIRRAVLQRFDLKHNSGVICIELVRKLQDAGANFAQIGVTHHFRAYGKSQFFNFPRLLQVGRGVVQLWVELVVKKEPFARAVGVR